MFIQLFNNLGNCLNFIMLDYLQKQIFFRGAIIYGFFLKINKKFSFSESAIDEVSSWYEESNWIKVHVTPNLKYYLQIFNNFNLATNYKKPNNYY